MSNENKSKSSNSVNTKNLRSRVVEINETDPNLRAKVIEGVWGESSKVSTDHQNVGKIVQSVDKSSAMAQSQELVFAADNITHREEEFRQREEKIQREYERLRNREMELERLNDEIHKNMYEKKENDKWLSGPSYSVNEALRRVTDASVTVGNESESQGLNDIGLRIMRMASASDSIIAPKHFTGRQGDVDAESWLEMFERYCEHKQMGNEGKRTLFPLFLREGASDWFGTLGREAFESYEKLRAAFVANYFGPVELRWQLTGSLWNQSQKADERVEDFVTRIRKRVG